MSAKVYLKPSGRKFPVEGRESILEAGLRAGFNLPYGCANGNCGKCKAQLLDGAISKIQHHDFHFSEAEKNMGFFLACSHRPVTDIEIKVDLTKNIGDIPYQDITAKVKKLVPLSEQVMALQVRLARADKLRFLAGQSLKLGGNEDVPEGEQHIASCPCNSVNLEFHIPLIPDDALSTYVFSGKLKPGNLLRLRGPNGQFVLFEDLVEVRDANIRDDEFELPPLIFICWHTGFAPIRSLIEHAMSFETDGPMTLYRLSPVKDDFYLDNLCRSWADALDNLQYVPLPTRSTLMSSKEDGELVIKEIAQRHDNLLDSEIYVAGPENLVMAANKVLAEFGVTPTRLKTEAICLGLCGRD